MRLLCKPAGFVTDDTILFLFPSFFYLWILSQQPSLHEMKEIDQKTFNTSRGNIFLSIPMYCYNIDITEKTVLGANFFLTPKSSLGGEKDINILLTKENKLNNKRLI